MIHFQWKAETDQEQNKHSSCSMQPTIIAYVYLLYTYLAEKLGLCYWIIVSIVFFVGSHVDDELRHLYRQ